MAAYPTLPTAYQSDPEPLPAIAIDRSEDGTARGRSFGNDKMRFRIKHNWLTSAQKSTLTTFYNTNKLIAFDYTSPTDGTTYSCIFSNAIKYERLVGDYWIAYVAFEEV